jgi:hypothetical protein
LKKVMAREAIATAVSVVPARACIRRIALCCALLLPASLLAVPALAAGNDDPMSAKLSSERIGDVETGDYSAGDNLHFTLIGYGDKFLLRYASSPEIFVLYPDRASLGGQVLKYDSGVTLLRVSVWGGMTIYTDSDPGGLPTTRNGDPSNLTHAPVTAATLNAALSDETGYLASARRLQISFSTDTLPPDPWVRTMAYDTLINTGMGLARYTMNPVGHEQVAGKISAVKILIGPKPVINLTGRTLNVTFVPAQGYAGRASSRAIALALGKLFAWRN